MTEEKIYVVIVTYNRLNLLIQCIAAVRDQTLAPHGIVIVDNASTDGTAEAIKGLAREDKRLTHLRLEENGGGAGGFGFGRWQHTCNIWSNTKAAITIAVVIGSRLMLRLHPWNWTPPGPVI